MRESDRRWFRLPRIGGSFEWIWIRVKGGGDKGGQGGNFIRLIRAATHTREVRHPVGMARRSLDALAVHMVDPANDGDDLGVNKPHRGHLCRMFQFYQDENERRFARSIPRANGPSEVIVYLFSIIVIINSNI